MGGGPSLALPSLPTENFMCITFTRRDKITMMYVSQQEIDICRQAILKHWTNGIQGERTRLPIENSNLLCYKFELCGEPFAKCGLLIPTIAMRRMAAKMLQDLYNIGWKLAVSSDTSRSMDLSTWYFERQVTKPSSFSFICIAMSSHDQLKIIDCPPNILKLLQDVIKVNWKRGIRIDEEVAPGVHNFRLKGDPWLDYRKDISCCARHLIREIISVLWNNQWVLYGTGNLKSTADTMFFMYNESQVADQEFVSVSLNDHDRIRLINVPNNVVSSVDDVVRMNWSKGIQDVFDNRPFCFEMKLCGNPWWSDGSEAIASRKLIVNIMERMASIGYYPISGIDISRKSTDKSLIMFKKGQPIQAKFFCVSLNSRDLIRIINSPENITEVAKNVIGYWPKDLADENKHYDGVSFQTRLKGNPWTSMYIGDGFQGRALLLALWTSFRNLGWRLICSADVSAKYDEDDAIDVHSWFFMYDETSMENYRAYIP